MIDQETAKKALRKAQKDPSAFSTDELEMLIQAAEGGKRSIDETPSMIGDMAYGGEKDGGAKLSGPIGGEKLEREIKPRGSMDDIIAAREAKPDLARAFSLTDPKFRTGKTDQERDAEVANHFQSGDPEHGKTASGRKDLFAPPEFIPDAPPPDPSVGPLDAFSASIDRARSRLPSFAGGKVDHYLEPSLSQFQREMFPALGPDVMKMGISSPQFHEYADQLWQAEYEKATAEGRPVVRTAYKAAKTLGEKAEKLGAEGIGAGVAAAVGADEAAFGGMVQRAATAFAPDDEDRKNWSRLAESHPYAHAGGALVGGASQIGIGGLAGKAAGAALPEAFTGLGAAARGAVQGSAAGMGTTASEALSRGEAPGVGELGLGGALGAPFGAIGGWHGHSLRQSTPLGAIEKADLGETEVLRGIRKSSRAGEIGVEAQKSGLGPGREADYLAGNLEEPMAAAGRRMEALTKEEIGNVQSQYFNLTKDVKKPATSLVKEAMDLHEKLVTDQGPLAYSGGDRRVLQEAISKTSHAEIVPSMNGQAATRSARPGSFDVDPDMAERMGINVDRAMQSYLADGNPAPGDYTVRVLPQRLNPEQTEDVIRLLGEHLNQGKNETALKSLMRASREVRDQFPAVGPISPEHTSSIDLGNEILPVKGWSAFQHDASQRVQDVQRKLGFNGLPETDVPERLTKNQALEQRSALMGFDQPGHHPDADAALREFAAIADQSKELNELSGMQGLQKMKGHLPTSRQDLLNAARLRLDPLLQFYGPAGSALLPFAPGIQQPQMPEQLPADEVKRQQIQMGFRPF